MIQFHIEKKFNLYPKLLYKRWLRHLIESKNYRCGNINYIFCDDEYLLELNKKFLKHDTFTDIITFEENEGNTISGDIFISIDRVKENAKKYKISFENELLRVMAHGVLHLCGYKDKKSSEREEMRIQEDLAIALFEEEEKNNN